jgi:uncharacterized protein YuzE
MQFVYDKQADAVAIWFKGVSPCRTVDLTEDIFMDIDEDGKLAGIEVLHASEKQTSLNSRKSPWNFLMTVALKLACPT